MTTNQQCNHENCSCQHNHTIATPIKVGRKIGRNEKCPCGSGKKYKKCCLNKKEFTLNV